MSSDCLPGVPLVESPLFEELAAPLDDETRRVAESLHRDGFAVIEFPEPELDAIAARLEVELAPHYAGSRAQWGTRTERVRDAWQINEGVKQLAVNAAVIGLLRAVYGRAPFPFQTVNFRSGSQQEPHVDAVHFHSVPERFMAGVWLALEDTDAENGPLVVYPGSHKLPVYTNEHLGLPPALPDDRFAYHARYEALWRELIRVHRLEPWEFHARKGQALIWAANLLHGGAKARDPARSRHSQLIHYLFEGCSYYAPFASLPFTGRINYLLPFDIRTGVQKESSVNDAPVPAEFVDAALRASGGEAAYRAPVLNVSALRHLFAAHDVPPHGLQVQGDRILLHPNAVGAPPATLVVDPIALPEESVLVAAVEVANERAEAVVFGIEVGGADGRAVASRRYRLAGGEAAQARIALPPDLASCRLTLTTRMAPGATSSEYAWARFNRLRFCPARTDDPVGVG